ncbi:MAG: hypothetical protein WC595_00955 [Candidatus Nanoarchaeia archaeon]
MEESKLEQTTNAFLRRTYATILEHLEPSPEEQATIEKRGITSPSLRRDIALFYGEPDVRTTVDQLLRFMLENEGLHTRRETNERFLKEHSTTTFANYPYPAVRTLIDATTTYLFDRIFTQPATLRMDQDTYHISKEGDHLRTKKLAKD